MVLMNQKLVKVKEIICHTQSVRQTILDQSNPSSHFLHWHLRTRHDSSWLREQKKAEINGIIVILCPCDHCWKQIIVYPYFILMNILFGLTEKKRINEFKIG